VTVERRGERFHYQVKELGVVGPGVEGGTHKTAETEDELLQAVRGELTSFKEGDVIVFEGLEHYSIASVMNAIREHLEG
jgi:hypothetical protein